MQRVRDTNTVPPGGGFRYRDPDSGVLLKHPYYRQLRAQAREHRMANNLPIGLLWDEQFDAAVCSEMPDVCDDTRSESEMTMPEKASLFAKSMVNWALSGFKVLSHEDYDARLTICKACPYWKWERRRFVACSKCGCSRLKLFIATVNCPIGKW